MDIILETAVSTTDCRRRVKEGVKVFSFTKGASYVHA